MSNVANGWVWFVFCIFLVIALGIDGYLSLRQVKREQMSVAIRRTIIWIVSAFVFNGLLWLYLYLTADPAFANKSALAFLTGYLIEKSLSVDNLFAFYLIFQQLKIPIKYQPRIFTYGIWSAIAMRLVLILIGTWLINQFHWILYVMGAFLFLTGLKMVFVIHRDTTLAESKLMILLKRYMRVTSEYSGQRFFLSKNAKIYATPLFLALILIEISDLIFAFDSIPAIFAITTDPFLVWSSNIFALLGLRSLYFVLFGLVERLHLLKYGIALILVFVGFKMLIEPWYEVPVGASLGVVALILLAFTGLSLRVANAVTGKDITKSKGKAK